MLDMLRRGATSKVAATLLFLPLIIAFAFWGIGPEWSGRSTTWLAKVGDQRIYPEEFQRAYQAEIEQISQQAGRRITAEQARYFGLDQRVLARLASTAALDQEVKGLGLSISTKAIADEVRTDPAFAELNGKFSKDRFDAIMKQNNLTEAGFLAMRRRDDVREQLTDSLLAGITPPQSTIDLMHRYREETRVIEHITLDPAKVVKLAEPDEAKLKEFYDGNKRQFMMPEQRKVGLLLLTRDAVKGKITVTDDEIKDTYETSKERFNIPESRHILQMSFADKASADKALPELQKAKNFVEAAVKLGAKETDLDLGTLTRKKMIDPKIADAAFALAKDAVSPVVEGAFATVILKVTEIIPGKQKTLAEVSTEIKDSLQTTRAAREMQTIGTQIEDERSAGKPLSEAAEKLGLIYKEIPALDRTGKTPDGKPAVDGPDGAPIAAAVFAGTVGLDADPVDLADGGSAWVSVLGVTPEKERPFDEVKADVKTAWTEAETRRELGTVAAGYVERAIKGESMTALATQAGTKLENTGAITRNTSPPGLTANGVQVAFTLPLNAASSALTADGKSRTVFKVTTINVPAEPSKEQADKLKQEMTRVMQADTLNTFVNGLQQRAGVNVNNALLQQLLGGQAGQQ